MSDVKMLIFTNSNCNLSRSLNTHKPPFNTVGNGLCAVPKEFNSGAFSEKTHYFMTKDCGTAHRPFPTVRFETER